MTWREWWKGLTFESKDGRKVTRKEWWGGMTFEEKRKLDRHDMTRDELWDSMTPEERDESFRRFAKFMLIGIPSCLLILFALWLTGNFSLNLHLR